MRTDDYKSVELFSFPSACTTRVELFGFMPSKELNYFLLGGPNAIRNLPRKFIDSFQGKKKLKKNIEGLFSGTP